MNRIRANASSTSHSKAYGPRRARCCADFARVDWSRPAPQGAALDQVTLVGEATSGTGLASVIAQAKAAAATLLAAELAALPDPDADD